MPIAYAVESDLTSDEFVDILQRSTLAQRRPLSDPERVERMVRHANLILTARDEGKLIGIARSLTDFSYCCYLSDLAVDRLYQRRGIGRELIRRTRMAAGDECAVLLLSAPQAISYYPRVGLRSVGNAFLLDRTV